MRLDLQEIRPPRSEAPQRGHEAVQHRDPEEDVSGVLPFSVSHTHVCLPDVILLKY